MVSKPSLLAFLYSFVLFQIINNTGDYLYLSFVFVFNTCFHFGWWCVVSAAGIPGLGGSSSPCALYTPEEVRIRLWPEKLVTSFATFRNQEV